MKRTLKQRIVFALILTIIGAVCGTLAGYPLGRAFVLRLAEGRLQHYAMQLVGAGEASTREAHSLLATLNASPFPYCSDAEIAYFRDLIFQMEYLRDAGRIRDGNIDCSASKGRPAQPLKLPAPEYTQQDGTKLFGNLTPPGTDNVRRLGLQQGESYVVLSSYILAHLKTDSAQYALTVTDPYGRPVGRLANTWPQERVAAILMQDGQTRLGDSLYATRCFASHLTCITAYISIPVTLRDNRRQFNDCIAMGGLIGASLGLICALLYRRSRSMEQQLRRAIRRDELRVLYQPIVDLASRRIVGAEALVRWTDEDDFAIGPDVFVKLAEERGFVGDITRLVVRHALRDFGETLRSHPDFQLNINLASADLRDPALFPMLEHFLEKSAVPARSLAVEITEGSTARHPMSLETILRLRRRGFGIDIDDFGTGYSSLSYLHDLPVDSIKIDRAFTRAIGTDAVTVTVLPQILAMADALNLGVVVEGIETELQADYFATYDRPILAQGWLFGYPVAADEFLCLLAADESKRGAVTA